MKRTLVFVVIAVLSFAAATRVLAQNSFVGTWKLNVAKSKYGLSSAPKSMVRTIQAEGEQFKYSFEGVAADGSPISYSFTAAYDGKDYPITGTGPAGADTISLKQASANSASATLKKSGQIVLMTKASVSADGKVTTLIQTSPKGSASNTLIYEKE